MNLEDRINHYQPSLKAIELVKSGQMLLIAGIVSAGKDTVVNELIKQPRYRRIISHTTRQPRINNGVAEVDGQDYHFISLEQAADMVNTQAFVETKYVHGNVYGTSVHEVEQIFNQDKIAITDIDIHGVKEYLDIKPNTHAVFLLPPSVDTWLRRLEKRYGNLDEHREEINKRFVTAYSEIKHIQADDRFVLVINDDLKTTVERIQGLVDGVITESSEYAEAVTGHLLDFLSTKS